MFSEELRDFAEFPLEANELAIKEASWQRDYFPAARLGPRGRWWYGGRGFKTKDALQASLSPADRKCIALHVGKSGHINSPGSLFIEGTMNAESLFASEEEAKRQTLVRL